jgi:hypothetical protein
MSHVLAVNRPWRSSRIQDVVKFGSERRAMTEMAEIAEPFAEPDPTPPRWELVECTCPDWCERDHEQD